MNSDFDVWTIQEDGSEVFEALGQIEGGLSIIYDNCICRIRIGKYSVSSRLFDVVLYNEEADILILIMKGSSATKKDMIDYLEVNDLQYVEVTFNSDINLRSDKTPELWFAREKCVLQDALDDSVNRGYTRGVYYPSVYGDLRIGYLSNDEHAYPVDGRYLKGAVMMPDKLVLLVKQANNVDQFGVSRNVTFVDVFKCAKKSGVFLEVNREANIDFNKKGPRRVRK